MTLECKGDRNLKIAEFIDSGALEALFEMPKNHLCSTIINRLYYGIYLIGKHKLLEKDTSIDADKSLSHGTESALKDINSNKEAKKSPCLWVRLKGFYPGKEGRQMCLLATKLHELRNTYDYNCDVEEAKALQDLEACKRQAQTLSKGLRRLQ